MTPREHVSTVVAREGLQKKCRAGRGEQPAGLKRGLSHRGPEQSHRQVPELLGVPGRPQL